MRAKFCFRFPISKLYDPCSEVMYANTRTTALRVRRCRRLRPPSDPHGLLPRLSPLVAFVRFSQGSLEERLLDRKTSRLETSTRRLAGRVTACPRCCRTSCGVHLDEI